jgi:hypothetical protein
MFEQSFSIKIEGGLLCVVCRDISDDAKRKKVFKDLKTYFNEYVFLFTTIIKFKAFIEGLGKADEVTVHYRSGWPGIKRYKYSNVWDKVMLVDVVYFFD